MRARLLVLAALTALAVAALPAPADAALRRCSVAGKERTFGASYVTSLHRQRTTCRNAERVVRSFHRCRRRAGGADGRCTRRVRLYRCRETRRRGATQYDARVSCRRGVRLIVHRYTQFT